MSLQQIKTEVLNQLFEGYQQAPGSLFDIGPVVQPYGANPHEIGRYLVQNGWVKNEQYLPQQFLCSISMEGIMETVPEYVENQTSRIISILGINGGQHSIMEVLDLEPVQFQKAFDLAKYLETAGLVTAQYLHNDVLIELTLEGRDFYERNAARFQ
jgi:hypothetical protein